MQNDLQHAIDTYLSDALDALPASVLRDAMRYALLGPGKRLRPLLCLNTAVMLGASQADALSAAAACECIHAYSLIHDDLPCMDDDAVRRGRPTLHIAFGEAMALLAGDALQALAFELAAEHPRVVALLARASGAAGMVLGQALDITGENTEPMRALKTGALIRASCLIGAAVAGVHDEQTQAEIEAALGAFGTHFGLAFQLRDDLLDNDATPDAAERLHAATSAALAALTPFGAKADGLRAPVYALMD